MNARSALFDLYGDHLLQRGGAAPVAALVRLLAPLDITPPAVRTAVSRLVRQGWLVAETLPTGRGYRITPQAERRLLSAGARIYRRGDNRWDGRWELLVIDPIPERARRDRVRRAIGYFGYAALAERTWVSPRPSTEILPALAAEGVAARVFDCGPISDGPRLAADTWELDRLGAAYRGWLAEARRLVAEAGPGVDDEAAFRLRSRLVHEWRKFLFLDPELPADLLPLDWPGRAAAVYFDDQTARLAAAAGRFVDDCLASP